MKMRRAYLFSIFIFLSGIPVIQAQSVCQGTGCESEGERILTNAALFHIRDSYLNLFMSQMNNAAALNSLMLTPAGVINLDETVSVSASGSAAWTLPEQSRPLVLPGTGFSASVPVAGAYFSYQFQGGVNLGRLMGMKYSPHKRDLALDPVTNALGDAEDTASDYIENKTGVRVSESNKEKREVTPGIFSPLRFDIYGIYMKSAFSHNPPYQENLFRPDLHFRPETRYESDAQGVLVRYHVIDSFRILGPLFRFKGLSAGTGYINQQTLVSYLNGNQDDISWNADGKPYYWDAVDSAQMKSRTETIPVELTGGIRLFYFLNLTLGGGAGFSKSKSSMELYRAGRYISGEEFLNWAAEKQRTGFQDISDLYSYPAGFKMYRVQASRTNHYTIFYLKQGTELDFHIFKVTYEIYATANGVQGATAGIRIEI